MAARITSRELIVAAVALAGLLAFSSNWLAAHYLVLIGSGLPAL